jgi:hypothetical protein
MSKKAIYVDICTLDYSVSFYNGKPKKHYGDLHGPFSSLGLAKKATATVMQCYIDEYKEMKRTIQECTLSELLSGEDE